MRDNETCATCRYWGGVVLHPETREAQIGMCAQLMFGPAPGSAPDPSEEWPEILTLATARCPCHATRPSAGDIA